MEQEKGKLKKIKAKNFSDDEDKDLLEFANPWSHVINNTQTNEATKDAKKMAWAEITTTFNMNSLRGLQRSPAELMGRYTRLKMTAKREAASHRQYASQTGGGTSFMPFGFSQEQVHGVPQPFDSNSRAQAFYFEDTYVVINNTK